MIKYLGKPGKGKAKAAATSEEPAPSSSSSTAAKVAATPAKKDSQAELLAKLMEQLESQKAEIAALKSSF